MHNDQANSSNKNPLPHRRQYLGPIRALSVLCVLLAFFFASLVAGVQPAGAGDLETPSPLVPELPTLTPAPELPPTASRVVELPTVPLPIQTPVLAATDTPTFVEVATQTATASPTVESSPTQVEPVATATPSPEAPSATATTDPFGGIALGIAPPVFATGTATPSPTRTGTATRTPTATPDWLPPGPECAPKPGATVVKLDVPYLHQVIDVNNAAGTWACGPVSVAMVLAYYGKLEPWQVYQALQTPTATPTRAATGTPARPTVEQHTGRALTASGFAPYVTNIYTSNGHTYSATARAPRGNRVAGLYGAICPTGYADWSMMIQVFQWNGLTGRHISVTWDGIVAALKRGHPVLVGNDLTRDGHILVAIGYTSNGQLIVNDPYGNRFAPGYGSSLGKGVFYPWTCMRARNALEVIGTYPPPTATATATATRTPAANGAVLDTLTAVAMAQQALQPSTRGQSTSSNKAMPTSGATPLAKAGAANSLTPEGQIAGSRLAGLAGTPPNTLGTAELRGMQGGRVLGASTSNSAKEVSGRWALLLVLGVGTAFVGLHRRRKAQKQTGTPEEESDAEQSAPTEER